MFIIKVRLHPIQVFITMCVLGCNYIVVRSVGLIRLIIEYLPPRDLSSPFLRLWPPQSFEINNRSVNRWCHFIAIRCC